MAASRKVTKNTDNAISSEHTTIKNFSTLLSKDDMENKNVSTDQCMSGKDISNNCISKLNNQNIEITGLSKLNPMRVKNVPVRSRYALFYNVCTQKHVTDVTTTGCHLRHRDRKPSRIQVKWLTRKFGKSRLLRKRLRHKIKRVYAADLEGVKLDLFTSQKNLENLEAKLELVNEVSVGKQDRVNQLKLALSLEEKKYAQLSSDLGFLVSQRNIEVDDLNTTITFLLERIKTVEALNDQ
ncbi:Hypothetical predicted protein [Paramuricea clavata]|uniref:Uncharacterized protein n=1 Tax=Paramuricea clavata TaxID=317549 RepID=A0A6S7JKI2_PARCT|nr:Hypothetical predicted protein [Paramuricea clavata]